MSGKKSFGNQYKKSITHLLMVFFAKHFLQKILSLVLDTIWLVLKSIPKCSHTLWFDFFPMSFNRYPFVIKNSSSTSAFSLTKLVDGIEDNDDHDDDVDAPLLGMYSEPESTNGSDNSESLSIFILINTHLRVFEKNDTLSIDALFLFFFFLIWLAIIRYQMMLNFFSDYFTDDNTLSNDDFFFHGKLTHTYYQYDHSEFAAFFDE